MARMARVVAAGLPHHVTQRGNRRLPTFLGAADYDLYVAILAEQCRQRGVAVWAWCLMPNHVHLILTPTEAPGMAGALGEAHRRYTRAINQREGWVGHLWQSRFASSVLDEPHLLAAARYVELNPVRAGLVTSPEAWPWSSARAHLQGLDDALTATAPLLRLVPDWRDFLATDHDPAKIEMLHRSERTGRPAASPAFVAKLEQQVGRRLRPGKPGPKPAGRQG